MTFVSRSKPADLPYPWVESGSAVADEVLGRAGLVVVATSAGEPVVIDRQLRPDATVLAVGRAGDCGGCGAARREAGGVAIAVEKGRLRGLTW